MGHLKSNVLFVFFLFWFVPLRISTAKVMDATGSECVCPFLIRRVVPGMDPQVRHTPDRLVGRVTECEYCGTVQGILDLSLPGDRLTGLLACKACSQRAIEDLKSFALEEGFHVVNKGLVEKLKAQGITGAEPFNDDFNFGHFKVRRTNGTIDDNWEFARANELYMPAVLIEGEQHLYAVLRSTDPTTPVVHKNVSVKDVCQVNGWDSLAFMKTLLENTNDFFTLSE